MPPGGLSFLSGPQRRPAERGKCLYGFMPGSFWRLILGLMVGAESPGNTCRQFDSLDPKDR